jgi:hypothetical protein
MTAPHLDRYFIGADYGRGTVGYWAFGVMVWAETLAAAIADGMSECRNMCGDGAVCREVIRYDGNEAHHRLVS